MPEGTVEVELIKGHGLKDVELIGFRWGSYSWIGSRRLAKFKVERPDGKFEGELEIRLKIFSKVGQEVAVDEHPVAKKLYVCKVEVAQEEFKQVVAGLWKFLPSSELLRKKLCLVLNLKAAKLAGQLSDAMILAGEAQIDESLAVKPPDGASIGDRVYLEASHCGMS